MTRLAPVSPLALLLFTFAAAPAAQNPTGSNPSVRSFDADRPGELPDGFAFAAMRQEGPGTWRVRRDGANGFLVHAADAAAAGFALAISPAAPLRDIVVSARLRLAGGGRAGGLVWRYLDASNYHAAVLDLARGELVLSRVTGGNRIILESEDGLELDADAWHVLKIVHDEARIEISLGGIRVFEERDRRYDPKVADGKAGIIATGTSEVWVDDLRIEPDRDRR
jgi:hypothetical protein